MGWFTKEEVKIKERGEILYDSICSKEYEIIKPFFGKIVKEWDITFILKDEDFDTLRRFLIKSNCYGFEPDKELLQIPGTVLKAQRKNKFEIIEKVEKTIELL